MRSRKAHSTNLIPPPPAGPFGDPSEYGIHEYQQLLDLHEKVTGVRLDPEVLRSAAVAAALAAAARQGRLQARRRQARAAGRRAGTISARLNAGGKAPYLRLSGRWLGAAGFELGRGFEVEVRPGELVIRAV
jgi:hypothetical protein